MHCKARHHVSFPAMLSFMNLDDARAIFIYDLSADRPPFPPIVTTVYHARCLLLPKRKYYQIGIPAGADAWLGCSIITSSTASGRSASATSQPLVRSETASSSSKWTILRPKFCYKSFTKPLVRNQSLLRLFCHLPAHHDGSISFTPSIVSP